MPGSAKVVPSLSDDGWVFDPINILDRVIAYAFASNQSQSLHYKEEITSISEIFSKDTKEEGFIEDEISTKISDLLSRYFEAIEVSAKTKDNKDRPGTKDLLLYVEVTDTEGKKHKLSSVISNKNTKLSIITDINNYGAS